MNRLRESEGGDEAEPGIELLRRTPPTGPMPGLKRRVWASLQERQMRHGRIRASRFVAVAFASVMIALAGSAGAMITGRWIIPALEHPAAAPAARTTGARSDRSRVVRRVADRSAALEATDPSVGAPNAAAAPNVDLDAARLDETVAPVRRSSVGTSRSGARAASVSVHPAISTAQAVAQERTEVLDALVALRRDHDPSRASMLLDRYLTAHRHGALREEALVLATEAADARGDHAAAERLARAYEAQYPEGRFHQFAQSHLGQPRD